MERRRRSGVHQEWSGAEREDPLQELHGGKTGATEKTSPIRCERKGLAKHREGGHPARVIMLRETYSGLSKPVKPDRGLTSHSGFDGSSLLMTLPAPCWGARGRS